MKTNSGKHADPRKGRGAGINPEGRFELERREAFDDGWDTPDEEGPRALRTHITIERAKSIISRNDSPDVGFSQSINPYAGCEHGCSYCASPETPVLMADGRTRPIIDLRVGDEIYGTRREGGGRRYVKSRVLAHWSVIKPAYRVTLEDGTQLVTSGDHRFLTERGWKFVTGHIGPGDVRRPHLTTSDKLMGTGAFARGIEKDADYRRGYLCGIVRCDATTGVHAYPDGPVHAFRLARCDDEALVRARGDLADVGILANERALQHASATRGAMRAIGTARGTQCRAIGELIAWPRDPTKSWTAGFLAGILDAEDSESAHVVRLPNADREIVDRIERGFRTFGLGVTVEETRVGGLQPMHVVRLVGGMREQLRCFHMVDPAIRRKLRIEGHAVKTDARLRVVDVEPLRAMRLVDITTETGDFIADGVVSHNCFARPSHGFRNLSPGIDFETRIFAKTNAAELLRAELSKPGYTCSTIVIGVNTDAYQPIEREMKITRSIIEVCSEFNQPIGLITKNATIERDIDLLAPMAHKRLAAVSISLNNLDHEIARRLEPRCASPSRRLQVIERLTQAGIPVNVLVAPVVPFITDHQLESVLEAAWAHGARGAAYILMRLPWEVKDVFKDWLERHYPLKAKHVMSLVHQMRGGRDNDPRFGTRMVGTGNFAELLSKRFRIACRRIGFGPGRERELDTSRFAVPGRDVQMPLF